MAMQWQKGDAGTGLGPAVPRAPEEVEPYDNDEGASQLFGDDDSEGEYQRSPPAISEEEDPPERGEHSAGSALGPAEHVA